MSWKYFNPVKIVFGEGALSELEGCLKGQRILLVTDSRLSSSGLAGRVQDILKDKEVILYDKIQPNPSSGSVNECGRLAGEGRAETVVGLGGGSCIDAAKAAALVARTGARIEEFLGGARKIEGRGLPVVAVPTTAGTGSEVTPVAVITNEEKDRKQPLGSEYLFPDIAVVDPELTWSMPAAVTASTGMDALSHGMEAYWSRNALPVTDTLAIACMVKVLRYLKRSVLNGNDREARREMSLASLLGGMSFALPKTAAVHACSFPLTHIFGIPHGTACALTLVPFLEFNYDVMKEKMDYLFRCAGYGSLKEFSSVVASLQKEIGLPAKLSECGIAREDIEKLADESFHPNILNNPREVSRKDLLGIYERLW